MPSDPSIFPLEELQRFLSTAPEKGQRKSTVVILESIGPILRALEDGLSVAQGETRDKIPGLMRQQRALAARLEERLRVIDMLDKFEEDQVELAARFAPPPLWK